MAKYCVEVDVTMCKHIYVEADSAYEASRVVEEGFDTNPYDYTYDFSHYVTHEVTDVNKDWE